MRGIVTAVSLLAAGSLFGGEPTWDVAAARHLLSRTGFGGNLDQAEQLAAMPRNQAVAKLLDEAVKAKAPPAPEWVRDVWVNGGRRWSDMSREEYLIRLRKNSTRNAAETNQLRAWWLQQMIESPAPLRERMTLYWHGHFTSAVNKLFSFSQGFYQQNATLRQHALGNFRELLEAITLDAAMMAYLDMERSDKAHPNENYARELLELFTLGEGNYSEKDVLEIARALTGWTLDAPPGAVVPKRPTDPDRLKFPSITRDGLYPKFVPEKHDDGEKTIFGKTGRFGMKDVLDLVAAHPACGKHLAQRMIDFFGANDPQGQLRERMAAAYYRSKYEIRPMLEVLLNSPEFDTASERGSRVKSPVRLVAGACRDLALQYQPSPSLAQLTVPMGQELFNPPTVKGWPNGGGWLSASTLAARLRLGESLIDGLELTGTEPLGRPRLTVLSRSKAEAEATTKRLLQIDEERRQMERKDGLKVTFEPARLFPAGVPEQPDQLVEAMLKRMIVTTVRPATRKALIEACREVPTGQRVAVVARLILASPEYQME